MFARVLLYSVLVFSIFLFTGCAGKSTDQQKEAVTSTTEQTPQDPCETMINEAAAEARATMRVVMKSCQDKNIEATPVWSLNYKGSVHVRIFDKNGTQIDAKYVQP
ncbi:MAG: hypothetical protein GQ541_07110 [Desulfovibrionaceae bacterium]|nr:hypothetical protein [Desulfovibrionaceae bacterium]